MYLIFQKRHVLLYGSPGTGKTILLMQLLRKRLAKYKQEKKKVQILIIIYHALVRTDSQIFIDMRKKYLPTLMLARNDYKLMHFKQACKGSDYCIFIKLFC